jgi:hypothetical protein
MNAHLTFLQALREHRKTLTREERAFLRSDPEAEAAALASWRDAWLAAVLRRCDARESLSLSVARSYVGLVGPAGVRDLRFAGNVDDLMKRLKPMDPWGLRSMPRHVFLGWDD